MASASRIQTISSGEGKGGALKGEFWKRIAFLRTVMEQAPPFPELTPSSNLTLTKEGEYYMVYCRNTVAKTVQLAGSAPYLVERLDMWDMTMIES